MRQKNHQEALAEIKRKKEQESEAKKKALLMFEEDRKELRREAEQKKLIQPKVVESKPVLKPGENQTKIRVCFSLKTSIYIILSCVNNVLNFVCYIKIIGTIRLKIVS